MNVKPPETTDVDYDSILFRLDIVEIIDYSDLTWGFIVRPPIAWWTYVPNYVGSV